MKAFGLPFWLAGAYGSRERFAGGARRRGARRPGRDRLRVLRGVRAGSGAARRGSSRTSSTARATSSRIRSPRRPASRSRWPSSTAHCPTRPPYEERPRLCDLGYLRRAYVRPDGRLDYRCPSEPVDDYVRKGGRLEDTVGRKCLCNALVTNIGMGQRRPDGYAELPMLTAGDDIACDPGVHHAGPPVVPRARRRRVAAAGRRLVRRVRARRGAAVGLLADDRPEEAHHDEEAAEQGDQADAAVRASWRPCAGRAAGRSRRRPPSR